MDTPVPQSRGRAHRGGLLGARPGRNPASSVHSGAADEAFPVGFRTFSRWQKSATLGPHSGSELSADFTSWTPAAYGVPLVPERSTGGGV